MRVFLVFLVSGAMLCGCGGDRQSAVLDAGVPPAMTGADATLGVLDARAADLASADTAVELTWTACTSSDWYPEYPKPPASVVQCTTVEVPLDYAQPEGKKMTLRLARQKSTAFPTGKAVFYLEGGPGGSAVEVSGLFYQYKLFGTLASTHDIVYVDRRGTGGSGYLTCPDGYPSTKAGWIKCGEANAQQELDRYMTVDCAHDLETVRKILGYEKIALYGGSYGTRLALEFMRQHEASVALAVLDGVATPEWDYFGDMLRTLDRNLAILIADCAKDSACTAIAPDVAGDLKAWRTKLKEQPRLIQVNGTAYYEGELLYLSVLEQALMVVSLRNQIPRAIHQALAGNTTLWNKVISSALGIKVTDGSALPWSVGAKPFRPPRPMPPHGSEALAPGLRIAVDCAESFPNSGGIATLQAIPTGQEWMDQDYFERIGKAEACLSWKVTPLAASLRQPVTAEVKTLLLSGMLDINTPIELAENAAKTLPNGTHLKFPQTVHGVLMTSCGRQIANDFIKAEGEIKAVDTSCISKIAGPVW